jgi:hypothetical protein
VIARGRALFAVFLAGLALGFVFLTLELEGTTRAAPLVVVLPTLALLLVNAVREWRERAQEAALRGGIAVFLWLAALTIAVQAVDAVVVIPLFLLLAMRFWARTGWPFAVALGALALAALRLSFPNGLGHPPLF